MATTSLLEHFPKIEDSTSGSRGGDIEAQARYPKSYKIIYPPLEHSRRDKSNITLQYDPIS